MKSKIFETLANKLRAANTILITTHKDPDLDGLAAEWAIAEYLTHMGKFFTIANHGTPDAVFSAFIDNDYSFKFAEPMGLKVEDYEIVVVFDTNELERTGFLVFSNSVCNTYKICIDHHEGVCYNFDLIIQDAAKSSTSEIVFHFLKEQEYPFSDKTAELLFAGICFDTGIFQYSRTSPTTFRVAAALCEQGVKPDRVVEILRQRKSETELRLLGEVLKNFVTDHNGKIAYAQLDKVQYERAEQLGIDYGGFCDHLLEISSLECSILFKEVSRDFVKVNLRSKHKIDVAAFASQIGSGGGHKHAAGLRLNMTLPDAIKYVLQHLKANPAWYIGEK